VAAPALSSRWIEKRKPHWTRLEALLARGRHGVSKLTHDELRELALLYRQTAADLSSARERRVDAQLATYLNQLLGRAHNLIYSGVRPRPRGLLGFYLHTFPQVFRDTWRYTLAATTIFLAGGVLGTSLSLADPGFQRFILGGAMMDTIERREMWTHGILAVKPLASSAITTNNLSVSFAAFALGITAGLGTAWLMLLNGVLIGTIGVACFRAGLSVSLWSFVAPHGALELPAIFIAGGAGLILGRGLLDPGTLPRREALGQAGGRAIRLLLGVIPLLVVAGAIEGFISPVPIGATTKLVIGAAMFTLLCLYLLRGGSRAESPTAAPAP
jgi:uncharacterized membrane protein SpoIIM required for sporulation